MIAIPQQDFDLIRNGRIRKRTLDLAVQYGKQFGERKGCPVQAGRVYTVRPRSRYAEYLAQAKKQPSRARAVLWLIDQCGEPSKTLTITVVSVQRMIGANLTIAAGMAEGPEREYWHVRFRLGDHVIQDEPVFLGRSRDYTTRRDELDAGEVMMPFREDMEAARRKAREKREDPERARMVQAIEANETHRASMKNMKRRQYWDWALKNMKKALAVPPDELLDYTEDSPADLGSDTRSRSTGTAVASLDAELGDAA